MRTHQKPINVVFLDIDGVMNSMASVDEVIEIQERCPNFPESTKGLWDNWDDWHPISSWRYFPSWSVKALNHITDATDAEIVISSTWRETAIPWLRRWGVRGDIIDVTPMIDRFRHKLPPLGAPKRGMEISLWLKRWATTPGRPPVKSFIILDDDADMGDLLPRLVRTDCRGRGLNMELAEQAVALMRNTHKMTHEELVQQIDHETGRVAAAFDVGPWDSTYEHEPDVLRHSGVDKQGNEVSWQVYEEGAKAGQWQFITIVSREPEKTWLFLDNYSDGLQIEVETKRGQKGAEAMARGLYRLGVENETVVSQLPPLSQHEKLELRLSMPREFWPQTWLDREVAHVN